MTTFSEIYIPITTTGSAGSATGSGVSAQLNALLYEISVLYHASAPSTTDVTISETGGAGRVLLTLTNNNTSGTYAPSVALVNSTGTALTAYVSPAIASRPITVSVAQCNALTNAVEVYLRIME